MEGPPRPPPCIRRCYTGIVSNRSTVLQDFNFWWRPPPCVENSNVCRFRVGFIKIRSFKIWNFADTSTLCKIIFQIVPQLKTCGMGEERGGGSRLVWLLLYIKYISFYIITTDQYPGPHYSTLVTVSLRPIGKDFQSFTVGFEQ